MKTAQPDRPRFFDRDISWLSFNERVLMEAGKESIPLLERLKFLAIYSSNLDEFYRVRIPSIMALNQVHKQKGEVLKRIHEIINQDLEQFGHTLKQDIIPGLKKKNVHVVYDEEIPAAVQQEVSELFFNKIAAYLQVVRLSEHENFFPENNQVYLAMVLKENKRDALAVVNIPSSLPRFHTMTVAGTTYVVTIDDIIRHHAPQLFVPAVVKGMYAFKVTRDAELNLKDEVAGSFTRRLEKQIAKRDLGFATRFLYDAAMPDACLKSLMKILKEQRASTVAGGRYHNLKDLMSFPLSDPACSYVKNKPVRIDLGKHASVFDLLDQQDVMVHTPYHNYDLILRFFNEAAIDPKVERIYITLYRVATDSAIGQALMTAARNGKKVTVLVELKARFDEANNIRWAKKMKAAGVKIIYSSPKLKVHSKIALIKRSDKKKSRYYGLFSTGNFNESTARVYTDHILLTAHKGMLQELQSVFKVLAKQKKSLAGKKDFRHLIVAPFTIRERFFELIDREIKHAKSGKPASVKIKLNNLEEETLIEKLYEASAAGVKIELLVRSICRIIPGVKGLSENIEVRRIVDRYLEHGRIFIFHNAGEEEVYAGSADWMNRNIYHRIEVCFPVYNTTIASELKTFMNLQLADTVQGVSIDQEMRNQPVATKGEQVHSQQAIYGIVAGGKE